MAIASKIIVVQAMHRNEHVYVINKGMICKTEIYFNQQ